MTTTVTRAKVINRIANQAVYGNLGIFAGTGLSIALTGGIAPTFKGILERICEEIGLADPFVDPKKCIGMSFPQIAEKIEQDAISKGGRTAIVQAIKNICSLQAEATVKEKIEKSLGIIEPSWFITTNYDLLLEQVYPNHILLHPKEKFATNPKSTPIFHLHGHIRSPEHIVITEKDYAELMSPMEYRQIKLATIMAESTVLMIGYSLGDINVRSALKIADAFGVSKKSAASGDIKFIQTVYNPTSPSPEVTFKDGIWVIETDNIAELLNEIAEKVEKKKRAYEQAIRLVGQKFDHGALSTGTTERIEAFELIEKAPGEVRAEAYDKFKESIESIWSSARSDGGFEHYETLVKYCIDYLSTKLILSLPPYFLTSIAEKLNGFAGYYGTTHGGQAWAASKYWNAHKCEIEEEVNSELTEISKSNSFSSLLRIL